MSDQPAVSRAPAVAPSTERRPVRLLPRITLEVRLDMPGWIRAAIALSSIVVGLVISGLVLIAAGVPAGDLLTEVAGSVVDSQSLHAVLIQAAPLILVGLAASVAFRARFWNLGLEGQMIWGGIGATLVSLLHLGPEALRPVLMAVAAVAGGILWAVVPLVLKMRLRVNEIIATLLLNYIAVDFLQHLLYGPWKDPGDAFPHSAEYAASERLPEIGPVNAALVVAIALVLVMAWAMQKSRFGFYLTFVHANPAMARRMGVPVATVTAAAVVVSGAVAALSGYVIAAGSTGRLTQGFFEGYGFSGVLIAFLARSNPTAAAVTAVLIGVLYVTGQTLQVFYQIPVAMVQLIQAVIVMCVAASEFFVRHRIVLHR